MSLQAAHAAIKEAVYINGTWVKTESTFCPGPAPAFGTPLPSAPKATVADVDAAAKAAAAAFKTWGVLPHGTRADWLRKLADALEAIKDNVASVEALNTGKPFREAQGDVDDACAAFRFCARQAENINTVYPAAPREALPMPEETGRIRYEPVGVVAAICPWNFPLMMAAWKVGPSLAAGCTVIVKPSEFTPFTALCLAEAAHAAGLPAGVLNVLTGAGDVGAALCTHPLVDKLSFTGSVPTGAKVMAAGAASIKRVTLELGGKSPAVVFEDADIDAAMEWLFFGFAWNAGQICSATARLIVHRSVHDAVVERLAHAARNVKIGGPFDEGVECGPVANTMQHGKVVGYIAKAIEEGCTLVVGGTKPADLPDHCKDGLFITPTIFTGVTPAHTIFKEEIFGPVACVTVFDTEEEAIALANDCEFGLAAAVFSKDIEKANRVADSIRAGTVWINHAQPSPHAMPWGGFKKSGVGREMGPFALLPFLEQKSVATWDVSAKLGWYPASHFTNQTGYRTHGRHAHAPTRAAAEEAIRRSTAPQARQDLSVLVKHESLHRRPQLTLRALHQRAHVHQMSLLRRNDSGTGR